jgi:hypothetical protein
MGEADTILKFILNDFEASEAPVGASIGHIALFGPDLDETTQTKRY